MKRKKLLSGRLLTGLCAILLLSIGLVSCSKLFSLLESCPSDAPYYCSSSKECCSSEYRWHGANGYCYKTKSDCQSATYSCEKCN